MDTIDTILMKAAERADEAEVYLSRSESVGAELSRDRVRIGQASHRIGPVSYTHLTLPTILLV